MSNRRIRDLVKQGAVSALSVAHAFPVVATPASDVLSLLRRLHPRRAGVDLIRMGPARDGGYLVPDDLQGIEACFSPGVGGIVGFERECVARGMRVFMADGSVESPVSGDPAYSFLKKYIGAVSTPDSITMDAWLREMLPSSHADLLLQIDIEGSEYETFLNMSDSLMHRFRIIVGEFHFLDQLWNRPYFGLAARAFEKILQTHTCVHIHPNNCTMPVARSGLTIPPVMEFTFLRSDRLCVDGYAAEFPHVLDADNTDAAHVELPACWFRVD